MPSSSVWSDFLSPQFSEGHTDQDGEGHCMSAIVPLDIFKLFNNNLKGYLPREFFHPEFFRPLTGCASSDISNEQDCRPIRVLQLFLDTADWLWDVHGRSNFHKLIVFNRVQNCTIHLTLGTVGRYVFYSSPI